MDEKTKFQGVTLEGDGAGIGFRTNQRCKAKLGGGYLEKDPLLSSPSLSFSSTRYRLWDLDWCQDQPAKKTKSMGPSYP